MWTLASLFSPKIRRFNGLLGRVEAFREADPHSYKRTAHAFYFADRIFQTVFKSNADFNSRPAKANQFVSSLMAIINKLDSMDMTSPGTSQYAPEKLGLALYLQKCSAARANEGKLADHIGRATAGLHRAGWEAQDKPTCSEFRDLAGAVLVKTTASRG